MAYKTLDKGPFFLFWNHWNFLGVYQNGNFTPLKGPHRKLLTGPFSLNPPLIYPSYGLRWFLIRPLRPASQNRLDTDPRYRHTYTEIAMYYDWLCLTGPSITSRTVHKHLGGAGCKMKFSSIIFQGPSLNLKNSWGSNLLADENKGKPHALGFNSTSWISIEKLPGVWLSFVEKSWIW